MTGFEAFVYEELDAKHSGGDEVQVDCIECGKEKHMYINIRTGLAYCFVCGYSANVMKLLMDVRGIEAQRARQESKQLLGSVQTRLDHRTEIGKGPYLMEAILHCLYEKEYKHAETKVKLPSNTHSISPGDAAADYLHSRRIKSTKTIRRHGLMRTSLLNIGATSKVRTLHVVFPDYSEDGTLQYYTTRTAVTNIVGIKSQHPKGISKPYLFGECFLKMQQNLILVEGPMDALSLSGWACPLLGKYLRTSAAAYIANKFTRVVLALDADAQDDAMQNAELLIQAGVPDVRIWDIQKLGKYNDPAELYERSNTTHDRLALHIFREARRINLSERVRAALPLSL